jgi:hypothetical protein
MCGAVLEVDVTAKVQSDDGAIDTTRAARMSTGAATTGPTLVMEVPLDLGADYLGPTVWEPDVQKANAQMFWVTPPIVASPAFEKASAILRVGLEGGGGTITAGAVHDDRILGLWSTDRNSYFPSGPPVEYTPPPELVSACGGAEQYRPLPDSNNEFTPFPNVAAAKAGVAGTWVRCFDNVVSDHAGFQILPDGSWRRLGFDNGELVARSGFGEEGVLRFWDNGPGKFQVDFTPFGRLSDSDMSLFSGSTTFASNRALAFWSQNEWPGAVYMPTTMPVSAAAPEYAAGERAGQAACADTEQGILPYAEARAALSGNYVLCSGELREGVARIQFDATDVDLFGLDGVLITHQHYEPQPDEGPAVGVNVGSGDQWRQWWVVASRNPLKLSIGEAGGAEKAAVFSATP